METPAPSPDSTSRIAFAVLAGGEPCRLCGHNPCLGHSRQSLVAGLVASGLLRASAADRTGEDEPALRRHLRPAA
jgi:hypothetical protein